MNFVSSEVQTPAWANQLTKFAGSNCNVIETSSKATTEHRASFKGENTLFTLS